MPARIQSGPGSGARFMQPCLQRAAIDAEQQESTRVLDRAEQTVVHALRLPLGLDQGPTASFRIEGGNIGLQIGGSLYPDLTSGDELLDSSNETEWTTCFSDQPGQVTDLFPQTAHFEKVESW